MRYYGTECPNCGAILANEQWRDDLSRREAEISGLCQECQDEFFDMKF